MSKKSKEKNPLILHLNYSEDQVEFQESNLTVESTGVYNPNYDSPVEPAPDEMHNVLAPFQKPVQESITNRIVAYNDFSNVQKPISFKQEKKKTSQIPDIFITANNGIQIKDTVKPLNGFLTGPKGDSWPSSTTIHCWHCCHSFTNMPIGIPIKLIPACGQASSSEGDQRNHLQYKFLVFGVFCSPGCALSYSYLPSNDVPIVQRLNIKQLLILMMKTITGQSHIHIAPAPSRLALTKFGGDMTIEQFRSCSDSNFIYGMYIQPLVPMRFEMECITSMEKKYRPIPKGRVEPVEVNSSVGVVKAPELDTAPLAKKKRAPKSTKSNTVDITNYFDMTTSSA